MALYMAKDVEDAIGGVPAELREQLRHWFAHLVDVAGTAGEKCPPLEALVRLVAGSEFAAAIVLRDWTWFAGNCTGHLPKVERMREVAAGIVASDASLDAKKSMLRRARQRFAVRILWQLAAAHDGEALLGPTLAALSSLADELIKASVCIAQAELEPRFGTPRGENGEFLPLVTLAMGKLGGRELNFSSDVDLIFLYPAEGDTTGPAKQSAHEYFVRLTRLVVALLDEVTEDGFVYRVDTRLRPFGESGPPVANFASFENYLLRHGRSWERYAYIKARPVTPDLEHPAVVELQRNLIEPFVYRRYLDYGVFESLRNMKHLISEEVRKRELADNIKLGPGGIREIEFIAQSLQLVRGGADRRLRCRGLQEVMPLLGQTRDINEGDIRQLLSAYSFLRRLENAIQAVRDQQTHDIPADDADRARLQVALGFADWKSLAMQCDAHREEVASQFANIAFRAADDESASGFAESVTALWESSAGGEEWAAFLGAHEFSRAEEVAAALVAFAAEPELEKIDAPAQRRLQQFMPALLSSLQQCADAGTACRRVLAIVAQILRRSAYLALLNENPATLRHLVVLCEQSAYLAREIARYPILLDELFDPRLVREPITAAGMRQDLAARLEQLDDADSEARVEALARFQRAAMFHIAVADFGGSLPVMKVSDRLTELAEIVIDSALTIAWHDLTSRHGFPSWQDAQGRHDAGIGIIAYGKLGGIELSYRSDLDLVFLHDSKGDEQTTSGDNPLDNSMFFSRLARRLTHFLTTQTGSGALYAVDTRLRPSGRSGLLVINLEGFERYQEENAWTWEHQALLRSRSVAGSVSIAREFERIRADTLCHRVHDESLLSDVREMRERMRSNLDTSNEDLFDLKQGEGGIGDIEFLVQYLVLKNASQHPALIHYSDNIRQLGMLGAVNCLSEADVTRLQECYRRYRLRLHRLVLNEAAPQIPASEFVAERDFVTSVWHKVMG